MGWYTIFQQIVCLYFSEKNNKKDGVMAEYF